MEQEKLIIDSGLTSHRGEPAVGFAWDLHVMTCTSDMWVFAHCARMRAEGK
jgi:hypothetical protein